MKRPQLLFRVRLLSAVIVVGALFLLGRLYQIQIINAEHYQEKAESQYVHTKTDLYSRGSILFTTRDGQTLSAAAIQSGYILAVNPTHLTTSPEEFCDIFEKYLDDSVEKCQERVALPNRTYIELATRITNEQSEEIQQLDIDGALLYKNQWR
ncbi:hypothetical protein KC850_01040, partial [Candidatus Kaiserbacteria bacterium]|nr:hypothetical protein [Candidatus Kaiserbacteria bacterium]